MTELYYENRRFNQFNLIVFTYMILIFIGQNGIDLLVSIIFPRLADNGWYSLAITIAGDFLIAVPIFIILIKKYPKIKMVQSVN